jgi:hypothetical protein
MATIKINGVTLAPQPARAVWQSDITEQKLNGTDEVGAFRIFRIESPKLAGQTFNWLDYENQVLTSLQAYAPGDPPDGADVVYSSGVVSRKVKEIQMPAEGATIAGVELEIAVVV